VVGTLYLLMNVSVLGVLRGGDGANTQPCTMFTMAVFMDRLFEYGRRVVVVLMGARSACFCVSLLLGYSRIPSPRREMANFPLGFGVLHPKHRIPMRSLSDAAA